LIGDKFDSIRAWLPIDPFVKAAAHPTATIVKDFDSFQFIW